MRLGSSTADLKVTATTGPTPGTVISRRQTASSRTIASTALCSFSYCAFKRCPRRKHRLSNALQRGLTCHQFPNPRFKRLAGHLPDLQAEAAQDAPNAQFHIYQPPQKLLARNQQRPDLLDPTDLACTGRNHPIRISCASPRASLRSVFTVIADKAAFTCRVSSRTASNPARISPA